MDVPILVAVNLSHKILIRPINPESFSISISSNSRVPPRNCASAPPPPSRRRRGLALTIMGNNCSQENYVISGSNYGNPGWKERRVQHSKCRVSIELAVSKNQMRIWNSQQSTGQRKDSNYKPFSCSFTSSSSKVLCSSAVPPTDIIQEKERKNPWSSFCCCWRRRLSVNNHLHAIFHAVSSSLLSIVIEWRNLNKVELSQVPLSSLGLLPLPPTIRLPPPLQCLTANAWLWITGALRLLLGGSAVECGCGRRRRPKGFIMLLLGSLLLLMFRSYFLLGG